MGSMDVDEVFLPHVSLRANQHTHFVGRVAEFSKAISGLASQGSTLAIIGERGIGKTSFGWRLREYMLGDYTWAQENRVYSPFQLKDYNVMWLEITKAHQNVYGIILDILTDRGTSRRWNEFSISNELSKAIYQENLDAQLREQVSSDVISAFKKDLQKAATYDFVPSLDLDGHLQDKVGLIRTFQDALISVNEATSRRTLLILDELDRLQDRSGLGEFLKTGNEVQTVLIGIADDISEIASGHPSSDRKIFLVPLERLSKQEVAEFIDRSNERLLQVNTNFTKKFSELLWEYSDGFPYICQRISRDALITALQKSRMKITPKAETKEIRIDSEQFFEALDGYLSPKADPKNRHATLRNSVDAVGKEQILFRVSEASNGWMSEDEIASDDDVSGYGFGRNLEELVKDEILVELHGSYRFIDPQMRAIVKLTRSRNKKLHRKRSNK